MYNVSLVKGLDVLLVGPNNLSVSLGVPGEIMGNEMNTAITRGVDVAKKHGEILPASRFSTKNLVSGWTQVMMKYLH